MAYEEHTAKVLTGIETQPWLLDVVTEQMDGARFDAIRELVRTAIAPTILPIVNLVGHGRTAQALSDWQHELATECSLMYHGLTADPDGPMMSRDDANATDELQLHQALRRGVKAAMNENYRTAKQLHEIWHRF